MKTSTLEQKDFDALLDWLSSDREEAGKKYEEMRDGLIRFFRFKGVRIAEELADETISRVAAKVETFDQSKNVKTITYFLGFATKILFEHSRTLKKEAVLRDTQQLVQEIDSIFEVEGDDRVGCLRACLSKLSAEERELIVAYYGGEESKKSELRKKLAKHFGWDISVLHIRLFRLRSKMATCITRCLKKKL